MASASDHAVLLLGCAPKTRGVAGNDLGRTTVSLRPRAPPPSHSCARAQRASTTANLATPCVTPPAQPQAEYKNGNDNCGSMGAVEKCCLLFTLCSFVGVIIILVWWYIDKNQGRPTTKYDYWSNR